eukprot:GEMP01008042.1.p1 GENE.GEMP01008042.1~~GEMP01008042.1.p1  ORF type:complete len:436 (+),score=66.53 GEMP01008042.1:1193-2500(+)
MVGNAADMTRTVMGYVNGGDDLRYSFGDTDRAPKFDAVTIPLNCPYAIAVHALLGVLAVRWRAWGSTLKTQAQDMEAMAIGAAELVLKTTTKSDIMPVMCSRWPLLELVDVMRFYPQVEYYSDSELAHRRINDGVLPNSAHNYSDDKRNSNRQLFHADKVARAIEYRTTTFVRHAERRLRNFVDEKWNAFDLLGPVFPLCPEADLQVYGTGDEERRICDITKLADGNPCIVVAIGSNGQWGFEEATYDRTDCIIHVFDCYGNFTPPPRIRDRVFSHRLCVSGKRRETNNPRFARYHELLRRANVTTQVTFLKMDIDGAEWASLPDIVDVRKARGHMPPLHIALELHRFVPYTAKMPLHFFFSPSDIRLLGDILFAAGYVIIYRRDNVWCGAFCSEFLLALVGTSQLGPHFVPSVPAGWMRPNHAYNQSLRNYYDR